MQLTYAKTRLWATLEAKADASSRKAKLAIETYMDEIETILAKGSSLKDFTLHDQDHSFRVAERMVDIIPPDVAEKLSPFELAFLLFAAYLHDVGMTPECSKLENLHTFLGGGPHSDLSAQEMESLQYWMDQEERTFTADNAAELVTYYCRHKHNDWSGDWTRDHIKESPSSLVLYSGWVSDLIRVCKSHHQDYEELIKNTFDPITRSGSLVHLRYLAAVLRIADILEFDPERTPEILFRHRQVDEKSRIYWLKDREVGLKVDSRSVRIEARPSSAILHRAVELMINDIDHELQLCRNLDARAPFNHNPADPKGELPHRWDLEPLVLRTIQPKDEDGRPAYEYINGAFRPDTNKLLQLLGGTELYGSPLAAIRELLQNAFDAVNEQIARDRLDLPDPLDRTAVEALRATHRVVVAIKVKEADRRVYLVCTDNGVGMSKSVIRDYLLVSGRGCRPEVGALARHCKEKRFPLDRSARFGIGVLSYFMLADQVVLRTWHNQGEGAEAHGWRFETAGIGSFGELRPDPGAKRGTEVTLRLRRELYEQAARQNCVSEQENWKEQAAAWQFEVFEYVRRILLRVPCKLEFECEKADLNLSVGPGWVESEDQIRTDLLNGSALEEYLPDSGHRLKHEVWEGDLPDGAGIFRLMLLYFDLPEGMSLAYFDAREPRDPAYTSGSIGIQPHFTIGSDLPAFRFGWRGMTVDSHLENNNAPDLYLLIHGDVDWLSDAVGNITVKRDEFKFSQLGLWAAVWLRAEVKNWVTDFLSRHVKSRYHLINCHLAYPKEWIIGPGEPEEIYWNFGPGAGLKEIVFPAATNLDLRWCADNAQRLAWHGKPVTVLPQLEIQLTGEADLTRVNPNFEIFAPTEVGSYPHHIFGISAVFGEWRWSPDRNPPGVTCKFPPMWERLAAVRFSGPGSRNSHQYLWNPANPVFKELDPKIWSQMHDSYRNMSEAVRTIGDLKGRGLGEAPAWLLRSLVEAQSLPAELLERCRRRQPSWLPVCMWQEDPSQPRLAVIGADGKASLYYASNRDEITRYLPDPGAEWELTQTEKGAV